MSQQYSLQAVSPEKRFVIFIPALAASLLTFLVYLPTLHYDFLNWDDWLYYEEPRLSPVDLSFFKWVFTSAVAGNWHPLTIISFALDFKFWGLNPLGYHLENIIFHSLNTSLVFILTVKLVRRAGPGHDLKAITAGLAASLLFGLHPLHVESVAWIAERKDVLSVFFYISAVFAYLKYAEGRFLYYPVAIILFMLALMSKPMSISLPLAILIIDFYPLGRIAHLKELKRPVLEKIPFFILSGASAYLTVWAQGQGGAVVPIERYPLLYRVAVAVRAYAFYIYKTILPVDLAPFYPLPARGEFFNHRFIISLFILLAITLFCLTAIKSKKVFAAVWAYFLVTLGPVIGIVQVGSQAAADRYMYLPSIGPFILAGVGAGLLFERFAGKKALIAMGAAFIIAVSIVLSVLTIKQEAIWKDSVALWSHDIKCYPGLALAYNFRGHAYTEVNKNREALEDYTTAIKLQPGFPDTYVNRGVLYKDMRQYDLAIADFSKAIELNPNLAVAYYNLGTVYSETGEVEYALAARRKAAELGYR